MAAAQPTPLFTVMAPVGQLSWQAPHSMQAFGATSCATRSGCAKTRCGQTMVHKPQPTHREES